MDLQTLVDESAVRALAAAYSDAVMRLDGVEAAETYHVDGVLAAFSGPEVVGREAVAAALTRVLSPLTFLSQSCANGRIHVDGDRATGRWLVTEIVGVKDAELSCCLGVYEDVMVRQGSGWRFMRRRFQPFYRGSLAGAGRFGRPLAYEQAFTLA